MMALIASTFRVAQSRRSWASAQKIIAAAVTLASVSGAIIVWLTVINVNPESVLALKNARAAAVESAAIWPFELMVKHSKNLPPEQWDAF